MGQHQIVARTREYSSATAGPVLVVHWQDTPTAEILRSQILPQARKLDERAGPDGFAVMIVASSDAPPPDQEARAENVKMAEEFESRLRGIASVIVGDGIKATTTRVAASALFLVTSSLTPNRVFRSLDTAAKWLAQRNPSVDPEVVVTAAKALAR